MGKFFNLHLLNTNILADVMTVPKRPFITSPEPKKRNLEAMRKEFNNPRIELSITDKRRANMAKAREARRLKREQNSGC